ncbi:hypothetical protein CLG96_02260 [Sphingomonas oleivorans]|uniref:Uncharacterized protein n=1 Tax=Sphingomonas oleivorans TaxID=1735121 RepID=A0A2T5G1G1_9SPHN|nr:hypothetical protein [Sphingomonas oleivorans]PTQ12989.1 hypothetical protein CLG96_02260 [Sphingomonas oleivorans]
MESSLKLPLSGDVTQSILPWNWTLNGNQFGNLNVYLGRTSDPELERRILDKVGTYGRQLGQIGDALRVLIAHVDLDRLSPEERLAIDKFDLQMREIELIKREKAIKKSSPA